MSGAESLWHTSGTLLQDFQSGFSSMLYRCPSVALSFLVCFLVTGSRSPSAALLLSSVFLTGTVFFSLLSNHSGFSFYSSVTMFAAAHAAFFHITAGVLTLLAVYHYSGLASPTGTSLRDNLLKSALLCLFFSAYFVLMENTSCSYCPLFFAKLFEPGGAEQTLFPVFRIVLYKTGHGALPVLIALFVTLVLHGEKLKRFQSPAQLVFSLPLALFGFYFFFIA